MFHKQQQSSLDFQFYSVNVPKFTSFSLCFSSCLLKILFDLWKCNLNFRRLKEHGMCANSVTISGHNSANAYKFSFDLSRNSHKYPDEEFEFIYRKCIIQYNICMWFRMESGAIDFDAFKTPFLHCSADSNVQKFLIQNLYGYFSRAISFLFLRKCFIFNFSLTMSKHIE